MTEEMASGYDDASDNVVSLDVPGPAAPQPPRPPRGLHGMAIAGMASCALIGIAAMLAFITVSWPGGSGRYVMGVFIAAGVGFMTCASLAVFSAARESYTVKDSKDGAGD